MINGKTVVGVIPARGGSKRVLRKNIRDLCGKPLIAWTVDAAMQSRSLDHIVLTSDDDEIVGAAQMGDRGTSIRRPPELATDDASSVDVVVHALDAVKKDFDYVVLLQPTSPLRDAGDIDGAVALCDGRAAPSCASVSETPLRPAWFKMMDENGQLQSLPGPGSEPNAGRPVILNGAVYVVRCDVLRRKRKFVDDESVGYLMPRERSVDIDDEFDMTVARLLKEQ